MPGGRPLKFNNCLDLQCMCELYFEHCEERDEHPTISGAALWLGVDRKTINNYAERDEFFPTIKKLKTYIEANLEQCLFGGNVAGVIFNLKNNFDWKDKQEIDMNATHKLEKLSDEELDREIERLKNG